VLDRPNTSQRLWTYEYKLPAGNSQKMHIVTDHPRLAFHTSLFGRRLLQSWTAREWLALKLTILAAGSLRQGGVCCDAAANKDRCRAMMARATGARRRQLTAVAQGTITRDPQRQGKFQSRDSGVKEARRENR
jgi:hypothetical protein